MATRSNISGGRIDNVLLMEKCRYGMLKQTFSSTTVTTFTLDDDSPPLVLLTPLVAATVTLPAASKGLRFLMRNMSTVTTFTLSIVDAAAAAVVSLAGNGVTAEVFSDGTSWFALKGA